MSGGLVARNVSVRFGGITALEDAAIEVAAGEIVGLVGRNGSGKSTLFNAVTGFIGRGGVASGDVSVDGRPLARARPDDVVRAGIARTFQTPRADPRMLVRDTVLCGCYPTGNANFVQAMFALPAVRREEHELRERVAEVLERFGLAELADVPIGRLSMGRLRLVDVARGVVSGARYLLLDEPAAGLSREEQRVLVERLRRLAQSGVGIVLVEHHFDLIRALCGTVTVLDSGRVLARGTPGEIASDVRVVEAYLGSSDDRALEEAVV